MQKKPTETKLHPHAEATFRVVPLKDQAAFGVEVTIPETFPTTITSFATAADAEAWIAAHKLRIAEGPPATRWRRSPRAFARVPAVRSSDG
ncbi:MAG TPA: hypothetical protein VFC38_00465 [Stellaceae bacterium]|nr:hypothetical protein [Stellaceae bacterium]